MITLRWSEGSEPSYQTEYAAGADLHASCDVVIAKGTRALVPTGLWIDSVVWEKVPPGAMPEIQIRARSGLAYRHGICLQNGVGTVDADYRDEIKVLLWNSGSEDFVVKKGDRIAQIVLSLTYRFGNINVGGQREGGFGSTSIN